MKKYQAVEIEIMYLSQEDVLSSLSQERQDDSFDGVWIIMLTKGLKKVLLVVCSLLLVACMGLCAMGIANAGSAFAAPVGSKNISQVSYGMKKGASVRINSEDGNLGIRFAGDMSADDYEALVDYGYDELIFGIIIAPSSYNDANPLNEENLFGTNAKYDWAEWKNGGWVYNGNKTRVINIEATSMEKVDGRYTHTGSITNIKETNLVREFIGVGYIKAVKGNDVAYKMADGSQTVRNVTQIAKAYQDQLSIKMKDGALDSDTLEMYIENYATLQKTYIDKVNAKFTQTGTPTTYTVAEVETANHTFKGVGTITKVVNGNFENVEFTQNGNDVTIALADIGVGVQNVYLVSESGNKAIQINAGAVEFGSYPQARVYDETLIAELDDEAGRLPTTTSLRGWTLYSTYVENNTKKFMWYKDIAIAGVTYRGVYLLNYRPSSCSFEQSEETSLQDENGYVKGATYWFEFKPLVWNVLSLDKTTNKALLLADDIIDAQQYFYKYSNAGANKYNESQIRTFLNENFFKTALTTAEQAKVQTTEVDNSAASTGGNNIYASANTNDKVFLLSKVEATNPAYGFVEKASSFNVPATCALRIKSVSDYALCLGARQNEINNGNWILRSPFSTTSSGDRIWAATTGGNLDSNFYVDSTTTGIVPAMYVIL